MRRVLALAAGVALAAGLFLSPAADATVRLLTTVKSPEQRSVRVLNYESPGHREDPVRLYKQAIAGTPDGVTNLYLMGSSELGAPVEQNPGVWLPKNSSDFDLYQSGRGFQQSLYHAIELAAVAPNLTNNKVALLVSPQWFSQGGIKAGAFESVFSYAAWNAMLANPHLSASTRQRLTARVGELMPQVCSVEASCATTALGTVQEVINLPYAAFAERVDELRATYHGTDYRKAVAYTGAWQPGKQAMATVDWVSEQAKASATGKSRISDPYGLDDSYYARRILPYLPKLKGHESAVTYTSSSEYGDLQLFLDVAHDLGIDVMLVSLPVNGLWSDFTGLRRAERDGFAAKIRSIAGANNARLTDLTVNSYEPYYFYDTIHLGWRGWLDVTRACWGFARS